VVKVVGLFLAALVAVTAVGVGTAQANSAQARGTVVRIIDGDTLVANVGGQQKTIRLLNVDTPETKDPNQAPECLGPEATEFLTGRLPVGSKVDLQYDKERTDRYGRTLAAVYESGSLINSEIAAKGLGTAVVFEPNRKYYEYVLAAQQTAVNAKIGLYDAQLKCTLPAEVDRVVQALEQVPAESAASSAEASVAFDAASAALLVGHGLETTLDAVASGRDALRFAAYASLVAGYRGRLDSAITRTVRLQQQHQEDFLRLQEEENRKAEEARLAEEARVAEEARLAEEARQAAAAVAPTPPIQPSIRTVTTTKTTSTPTRAPQTTTQPNPYPGYTGPRCYAPGGKTWKPC
jgi:micrococcal nuclease